MSARDRKVLSYGDVVLRASDVALLEGRYWLNDAIVAFYMDYLTRSREEERLGGIVLIEPSVTFWIRLCKGRKEDLEPTMAALRLHDQKVIAFAVNDNEAVDTPEGGSHWSLLLYSRDEEKFMHFDSGGGHNFSAALELVEAVRPFLGSEAVNSRLFQADSPQQENGYDCGMYLLAICRTLVDDFRENNRISLLDLEETIKARVTGKYVRMMRKELLALIVSLAKGCYA